MSGECDKCGEHCLDCKCDNFFFEGQWFSSAEKMFEFAFKWNDLALDQQTAKSILDKLTKDIILNIFLRGVKFSNREFSNYIKKLFEFSIRNLPDMINQGQE